MEEGMTRVSIQVEAEMEVVGRYSVACTAIWETVFTGSCKNSLFHPVFADQRWEDLKMPEIVQAFFMISQLV